MGVVSDSDQVAQRAGVPRLVSSWWESCGTTLHRFGRHWQLNLVGLRRFRMFLRSHRFETFRNRSGGKDCHHSWMQFGGYLRTGRWILGAFTHSQAHAVPPVPENGRSISRAEYLQRVGYRRSIVTGRGAIMYPGARAEATIAAVGFSRRMRPFSQAWRSCAEKSRAATCDQESRSDSVIDPRLGRNARLVNEGEVRPPQHGGGDPDRK